MHLKSLQKERQHGIKVGTLDDFSCWHLVENGVRPMLLARAKADRWNTCLTHPVSGIGRKNPFASLCRTSITAFKSSLACPHIGMILWQRPGGKDFFYRKGEARIAWHFIQRHDDLGYMSVWQSTQFVHHNLFGLGGLHAAININATFVRNGVERGSARADIGHSDGARAKK